MYTHTHTHTPSNSQGSSPAGLCWFSHNKDVVHVMPTKCLKAENLFDIIY